MFSSITLRADRVGGLKVVLIAKFAAELLGNEVRNHQFVMRQHVLEELSAHAGSADRGGDQH